MKWKRNILWLLVIAVALVALGWFALDPGHPPEPLYQGKPLTYWLRRGSQMGQWKGQQQSSFPTWTGTSRSGYVQLAPPVTARDLEGPEVPDIPEMLRTIGTNAIPTLLWLLRAKDSTITIRAREIVERIPLIHYSYWEAPNRNATAAWAFQVLSNRAECAVPELIRIYEQHISEESEIATAQSLEAIGPAAEAAIPAFLRRLPYTNDALRDAALSALGGIHERPELALPVLIAELGSTNSDWQSSVADALGKFGTNAGAAVPALMREINHTNEDVRGSVIDALGEIHCSPTLVIPALVIALEETNGHFQDNAATALGKFGTESKVAVPALLAAMTSTNEEVRSAIAAALGEIRCLPELVVPALTNALMDPSESVMASAAGGLGKFGADAKGAVPVLLDMLNPGNFRTHGVICAALEEIHAEPALVVPKLIEELADPNNLRVAAVETLGTFGTDAKPATAALLKILAEPDEDEDLAETVTAALKKIDPAALEQARKEGKVRPR